MERRQFIGLVTGAAVCPIAAAHARSTMPIIGLLRSTSLAASNHLVAAFREGLKSAGIARKALVRRAWSLIDVNDMLTAADSSLDAVSVVVASNVKVNACHLGICPQMSIP